jgi:hypothetical protein
MAVASIYTIVTGLFQLRRKPTFLIGKKYYGFYMVLLSIMMIITIVGTIMKTLNIESIGSLAPLLFPILLMILIARLLNGWLIFNINESALSKIFDDSLKAMGINYEKELTRIMLRDFDAEMRISVGHQMRTCSVYFINREGIKNYRELVDKVKEGLSVYQTEPSYVPAIIFIIMGLLIGFGFLTVFWLIFKSL